MHPNMYDLNSVIIITFHGLIKNQIIEVSGCFFSERKEKRTVGVPADGPRFSQSRYRLKER